MTIARNALGAGVRPASVGKTASRHSGWLAASVFLAGLIAAVPAQAASITDDARFEGIALTVSANSSNNCAFIATAEGPGQSQYQTDYWSGASASAQATFDNAGDLVSVSVSVPSPSATTYGMFELADTTGLASATLTLTLDQNDLDVYADAQALCNQSQPTTPPFPPGGPTGPTGPFPPGGGSGGTVPTTISMSPDGGPAEVGTAVGLLFIVDAGGAPVGGTVQLYVDDVAYGDPADIFMNFTSIDVTFDSTGNKVVKAVYSGDSTYAGSSVSETFSVTAAPPANKAPRISTTGTASVAENTTTVVDVDASDDSDSEGSGLTYSISSGADSTLFSINTSTGVLSFKSAPDFESPSDADGDNVYEVEITVTDSGLLTNKQRFAVTVTDVVEATPNKAPSITTGATASVAENTTYVMDVDASDDSDSESNGLTYSISGGKDSALFTINSGSGVLAFIAAPDFEAPADDGGNNVYNVEVAVTDSGFETDKLLLAVTVTDVVETPPNKAPSITTGATASVAENTTYVVDVDATDDTDAEGNGLTYSISGGKDSALFTISSGSGALAFIAAPDFEAPADTNGDNVYEVEVMVSDSGLLTNKQRFAVTVTDVVEVAPNKAPSITTGSTASVAENTTYVVDVDATDDADAESNGLSYSISGGKDSALFTINSGSGALAFIAAPDFESPADDGRNNVYNVEVTVTDSGLLTGKLLMAITVTDVVETPPNKAPRIATTLISPVPENTTFVVDVDASDDVDSESNSGLTYSISGGGDSDKFSIDARTGVLRFKTAPDFEAPTDASGDNTYHVEVQVTDSGLLSARKSYTVTVTDVDETPPNRAPLITTSGIVSVPENSKDIVDLETDDEDVEGEWLRYEVIGGPDWLKVMINQKTGSIRFNDTPDFESPNDADKNNVYEFVVRVSDSWDETDTINMSVTVTDVNETPPNSAPTITTPGTASVAENTTIVVDVDASDDTDSEGKGLIYSISGGKDSALFTIDGNSGVLDFKSAPDFEAPTDDGRDNVYNVEVTVTDSGSLTAVLAFSVTVADVVEVTPQQPTSLSVTSDANDVTAGTSVRLTVTASSENGTPDGDVTLQIGEDIVTLSLIEGSATYDVVLGVGQYEVSATYEGNAKYARSTATMTLKYWAQPTPRLLNSHVQAKLVSPKLNKPAKIRVVVEGYSAGYPKPTGTVRVDIGDKSISGRLSNGTITLNPNVKLKPGLEIRAYYQGDSVYRPSADFIKVRVSLKEPDLTFTASNPAPQRGSAVQFTAVVGYDGDPLDGVIEFTGPGAPLEPVTVEDGEAGFDTLAQGSGLQEYTAHFIPDDESFDEVDATAAITVDYVAPAAMVVASPNPSLPGEKVTISVTSNEMSGDIKLRILTDETYPRVWDVDGSLVNGKATLEFTFDAAGKYIIEGWVGDSRVEGVSHKVEGAVQQSSSYTFKVQQVAIGTSLEIFDNPDITMSVDMPDTGNAFFPDRFAFNASLWAIQEASGAQKRSAFNFWLGGKAGTISSSDANGWTVSGALGADYMFSPQLIGGLGLMFDRVTLKDRNGTDTIGNGWIATPYLKGNITDSLAYKLQAGYGRVTNEVTPLGATYTDVINGDRKVFSGSLVGTIQVGDYTINPSGSVTYFDQTMEAFVDGQGNAIPSMSMGTVTVTLSPAISRRFDLDGMALTLGGNLQLGASASNDGAGWAFSGLRDGAGISLSLALPGGATFRADAGVGGVVLGDAFTTRGSISLTANIN